ncbi:keratin, type I cytoskeletal 9-like [Impatiens glandulifera]|uniref:keratin, type I cytoskeletal 9-like n=1 Tax=Impatiens glandulifera TaxID=253017 RepID=UPI001FB09D57|nr:keratin, type I cytoskeletal 9-like [Impatiens glandulifera]
MEPVKTLITQEEEALESPVLESEASIEKKAEASQPNEARSEGELSKEKESEKSSSSEREQDKNDPRPFPDITSANVHDDVVNLPHHSNGSSDKIHKVCEDILGDEEERKSSSDSEKDESEQSLQVHTHFSPIRTTLVDSQEMSSNEGSSTGGAKLMKSMTAMMGILQKNVAEMQSNMIKIMKTQKSNKKEFASLLKTHNEMENAIELHNEVMDGMNLIQNQMIEIQGHMSRADVERLEQADSFARQIQTAEDAQEGADKEKNLISQGDDYVKKGEGSSRSGISSRGGDGVSTGTRSKRKKTGDESNRPIKRGRGRIGDHGGRSGGGDPGGRGGGSGRGGRSLPPFRNLLIGEEFSSQGFYYPIDPLVKREDQ